MLASANTSNKFIPICKVTSLVLISMAAFLYESTPVFGRDVNVEIDDEVLRQLEVSPRVEVIISIKEAREYHCEKGFSRKECLNSIRLKAEYFSEIIQSVLSTLDESDFALKRIFLFKDGFVGTITKSGLEKLKTNRKISHIHLNLKGEYFIAESVPLVNASIVWDERIDSINITGKSQTICVIDSGVNYSHSDLGACNVTDDINDASCNKVIGGYDYCATWALGSCLTTDANPMDDYGHGTKVAGITASTNLSRRGVAPDSKIVALKISAASNPPNEDAAVDAVQWCLNRSVTHNISVITMSFGLYGWTGDENCYPTRDLSDWINRAREEYGVFVDIASGNTGNTEAISYPACANATSVGMTYDSNDYVSQEWPGASCNDSADELLDYAACCTNRDENLDLLAPGDWIYSPVMSGGWADTGGGTSLAAPHVAGMAALLIQYEKVKNNRTLIPKEIEQRLKDTGKLIYDSGEYSTNGGTNFTFSRIDAYAALFPIDVYDFRRLKASSTQNIFGFKIKNNYNNKTKNVSWSLDIGNGTTITSNDNISLPPGNTSFVYFEHNYSDGNIYTVEASATSGDVSDSETMTLTIGDIIAYDLSEIYANGKERVFRFRILNNMNDVRMVNWTMNTWKESISADKLTTLQPGNETFVYFHYNYTSGCDNCTVYARATNGSISDNTNYITVNVPN